MPAYFEHARTVRPRERVIALAAVVLVQLVIGFVLLSGLRVQIGSSPEPVQRLIGITLLPPPPPPPPPPVVERKAARSPASARKAEADPLGGSPGPKPAHAPPSVTPVVPVQPTVAPSGGGTGSGPALGSGAGGGTGGNGHGAGAGGADLELISGDIGPRDYPRRLAKAGIGGTVKMRCTVGPNGRVVRCSVIRSSGVPELDAVTPRLIEQRFVYRPATDRYGRPVADDVEIDWTWD